MKRGLLLTGLATLALVIGLIWKMPAVQALGFAPQGSLPPLSGVGGTLADGRAGNMQIGRREIGPFSWQLRPWSLLMLHPRYELRVEQPVLARGTLVASPGGRVTLTDWQATATIKKLATSLGYAFVPVSGDAGVRLQHLQLEGRRPKEIRGQIELHHFAWTLGSQRLPIGDVRAELAPEDGVETAVISDLGGPLEIAGRARLELDGRYDLNLRIKARPEADQRLVNLLRGLGRPDAQQNYTLKYAGQLP